MRLTISQLPVGEEEWLLSALFFRRLSLAWCKNCWGTRLSGVLAVVPRCALFSELCRRVGLSLRSVLSFRHLHTSCCMLRGMQAAPTCALRGHHVTQCPPRLQVVRC